jgi:ABC-type multidrug transport system fused ATPase/permease subunit
MLRPGAGKYEKVKLSEDSYKKAKRIFAYLKPYTGTFIIGWIFLIGSSSIGLIFPYLMGQILGAPIGKTGTSKDMIFNLLDTNSINSLALALFILFFLQSIFSFFRIVLFTNVAENSLRDIRKDAFERLIYMPMDFFNRNKVGELTSRISADINLIQDALKTTVAEFFRQVITILGVVTWLFFISWKLALIMILSVPVMAIIAVFFGRFIKKLSKKAQDSAAQSNGVLEESLMGISNVKAFTNEALELLRFRKVIEEIRQLNVKSGIWKGFFVSFIFLFLFGAIIFIIWRGMLMVQLGELGQQNFFSFLMFTVMLGASVGSIPDLYAKMQSAVGSTEHLMDIINESSEKEIFTGKETHLLSGKVEFKNVGFSYPQRKDIEVLRGIDFFVSPGQTVALVGSSGAGKSTISSLLLRYYAIDKGEILFDNVSIDAYDIKNLRSQIAIVPQEVILFSGSIRENIAYGKPGSSQEEIIEAARKANALQFIESFPEKFETEVGDRGIQLSGGQKQRVAIARALLKNPSILILDEATSALDSESERLVQNALDELMKGRTSIVIAHRLSTIRKADKILVIEHGKIVEEGKHEELIRLDKGIYANLTQLQGAFN